MGRQAARLRRGAVPFVGRLLERHARRVDGVHGHLAARGLAPLRALHLGVQRGAAERERARRQRHGLDLHGRPPAVALGLLEVLGAPRLARLRPAVGPVALVVHAHVLAEHRAARVQRAHLHGLEHRARVVGLLRGVERLARVRELLRGGGAAVQVGRVHGRARARVARARAHVLRAEHEPLVGVVARAQIGALRDARPGHAVVHAPVAAAAPGHGARARVEREAVALGHVLARVALDRGAVAAPARAVVLARRGGAGPARGRARRHPVVRLGRAVRRLVDVGLPLVVEAALGRDGVALLLLVRRHGARERVARERHQHAAAPLVELVDDAEPGHDADAEPLLEVRAAAAHHVLPLRAHAAAVAHAVARGVLARVQRAAARDDRPLGARERGRRDVGLGLAARGARGRRPARELEVLLAPPHLEQRLAAEVEAVVALFDVGLLVAQLDARVLPRVALAFALLERAPRERLAAHREAVGQALAAVDRRVVLVLDVLGVPRGEARRAAGQDRVVAARRPRGAHARARPRHARDRVHVVRVVVVPRAVLLAPVPAFLDAARGENPARAIAHAATRGPFPPVHGGVLLRGHGVARDRVGVRVGRVPAGHFAPVQAREHVRLGLVLARSGGGGGRGRTPR